MANRVTTERNGQQGLWISPPGVNVLTAPNTQLQFTSDWPSLGLAMEGVHNVNWVIPSNQNSWDQSVWFPQPFPTPPATEFTLFIDGQARSVATGGGLYINIAVRQQIGGSTGIIADYIFRARPYADRLRFYGDWTRNSSSYNIPNLTIGYKVYAYNY